jgi:hypothetical protein
MNDFFSINFRDFVILDDSLWVKIKNLLFAFLFTFIIILGISVTIVYPMDLLVVKVFHFESIKGLINQSESNVDKLFPIYAIVLIGPFVEELLFRLALKVTKLNISIFLGILLYKILGGQILRFDIHNTAYVYDIVISLCFCIGSYFLLPTKIIAFLNTKINGLAIISIIGFGLIHILNLKILHWQLALFYPLYFLPHMVLGYFITHLRLRSGFIWGVGLHALINLISVLLIN